MGTFGFRKREVCVRIQYASQIEITVSNIVVYGIDFCLGFVLFAVMPDK